MSQPLTVDCPTCGAPVEWTATNLKKVNGGFQNGLFRENK